MILSNKISQIFQILCLTIWLILCFIISIDTDMFVYKSLSMTLLCEICILLLLVIVMLHWIIYKTKFPFGYVQLFVILWSCYMCAHTLYVAEAELYRFYYIEITLLLLILFPYMLRTNILSVKMIENGIIVMLVIQLVSLFLQTLGAVQSSSQFFSLTGTNINPNVTANLIMLSVPLLFKRVKTSSHFYFYILLILSSLIYLLILNCRTSYIGLAIVLIVLMLNSDKVRLQIKKLSSTMKIIICISFLFLISISSIYLYGSKQSSSDGRLLVWKLSSRMIVEQPQGIGIGNFVRDYNLRQGKYFSEEPSTPEERKLASCVFMAYNDYLEYGVETGIAGMLFMIMFYVLLIYSSKKHHEKLSLSVIVAFMVMSLVNFMYSSIQPWVVFLCYAGIALRNDDLKNMKIPCIQLPIKIVCLVACLLVIYRQINIIKAQMVLKSYQTALKNNEKISIDDAQSLSSVISTSEAYWRFMAELNSQKGNYAESYRCLKMASRYTTDLRIFFPLYFSCEKLGVAHYGLKYLEQIRSIIPQNLYSRYLLLKYYTHHNMQEHSKSMANEILNVPIKIKNEQSYKIKHYAESVLSNINSNNNNKNNQL